MRFWASLDEKGVIRSVEVGEGGVVRVCVDPRSEREAPCVVGGRGLGCVEGAGEGTCAWVTPEKRETTKQANKQSCERGESLFVCIRRSFGCVPWVKAG